MRYDRITDEMGLRKVYPYVLLACTWIFLLVSLVFLWIRHGLAPPIALWFLLAAIALIPLAQRLKVGSWFDFTGKVDNLSKEVSSTQKEVQEVRSRLDVFISNVQSQQLTNIALPTEEAARAFVESMLSAQKARHLVVPRTKKISSAGEDTFFSEKMSPTDRQRFFFVSAADEAVASADPMIRTFYAGMILRDEKKLAPADQAYGKTLVAVIEELPTYIKKTFERPNGAIDEVGNALLRYLQSVRTLIERVDNVQKESVEPPSVEEGRELVRGVQEAVAYFSGVMSVLIGVLFVPEMRGWRIPRDKRQD